ncbi:unnamed protein product [Prunus armeniaca]
MALSYTFIETLGRVELGSTQFTPTDPNSHTDLNRNVDELTKRFEDSNNLADWLLWQIDLIRDFEFGLIGEEKRMDKSTEVKDRNVLIRDQSKASVHSRLGL